MIAHILRKLRERKARKRLAELVEQTRNSYEIARYRERRAAAKLGHQRRRAGA